MTLRHVIVMTALLEYVCIFERGDERDTCPQHVTRECGNVQLELCLIIGHALLKFRFMTRVSWRAVRFLIKTLS